MRERLKEPLAAEVIRYLIEPWIKSDLETSYDKLLEINMAHLVMLVEQEIVTAETGKKIGKAIMEMEVKGPAILEIDFTLEDLFFNIESYIINETGIEVGGQLHTGRSRNDFFATITRMNSRDYLLKICSLMNELRSTLLQFANNQREVVMSGYTHLQPAEPITLAHYLSGILQAFERDYTRLFNALNRLNECPMGSGALAGTSFSIDRELTAKLLGFDYYTKNSLDGVASRDYLLEILSSLSIFTSNLSRLAHDFYIWSTSEFSYIEVGNSVAICSSIMPQKKNPLTLEHVKAKAAHVQGALVSCLSSLKNTPFSHSCDVCIESPQYFWDALHEVEASISLMIATVKTIKVNKENMLSRARHNFSTVTELANLLVKEAELSFTEAHQLVASLVSDLLANHQTAENIDEQKLAHHSQKMLRKEIRLTTNQLQKVLNPVTNVQLKTVAGGPAPNEVELQLQVLWNQWRTDECQQAEKIERIVDGRNLLKEKVNLLLNT